MAAEGGDLALSVVPSAAEFPCDGAPSLTSPTSPGPHTTCQDGVHVASCATLKGQPSDVWGGGAADRPPSLRRQRQPEVSGAVP